MEASRNFEKNVDWRLVRDQFPLDRDYPHLSQFYIVSHPKTVRDAIERQRCAIDENPFLATERGMFGTDAQSAGIMNDEAEVDRALAAVAELANARRMAV